MMTQTADNHSFRPNCNSEHNICVMCCYGDILSCARNEWNCVVSQRTLSKHLKIKTSVVIKKPPTQITLCHLSVFVYEDKHSKVQYFHIDLP